MKVKVAFSGKKHKNKLLFIDKLAKQKDKQFTCLSIVHGHNFSSETYFILDGDLNLQPLLCTPQ